MCTARRIGSALLTNLQAPYLLFLGDEPDRTLAKTAHGIAFWRPERCVGQLRLGGTVADVGLPEMDIPTALRSGARTLVIGVANVGGYIPESWVETLVSALDAGMDLASGMHSRLEDIPAVREAAVRNARRLHDVRHPTRSYPPGNGRPRSGKRLLTVGTDCAVGKMFSSLAVEREMISRGLSADFRATGQTGILIQGSGVSVDAVVSDFVSGAAEALSPANDPDHWDVIEGQGSLHHPAYAGVTLGLIHGSQPTALLVCSVAGRTRLFDMPDYPTPSLQECIDRNLEAARLTSPEVFCAGVSLNTAHLGEAERSDLLAQTAEELGVPCVDPVATGVRAIVDLLENR